MALRVTAPLVRCLSWTLFVAFSRLWWRFGVLVFDKYVLHCVGG